MRRRTRRWIGVHTKVNPAFYGSAYTDLATLNDEALVAHWRSYGVHEERIPSWTALRRAMKESGMPFRDFNWPDYLALNPDLLNTAINSPAQLGLHYFREGYREGRPIGTQIATDIPKEILNAVPPSANDDAYWSAPPKARFVPAPRWDRRAAKAFSQGAGEFLDGLSLIAFITETYRHFLDTVPSHTELSKWCAEVDCGLRTRFEVFCLIAGHRRGMSRAEILAELQAPAGPAGQDTDAPRLIHVMGFPIMPVNEWTAAAERIRTADPAKATLPSLSDGRPVGAPPVEPTPTASVICSMYRTDAYLDSFLGNVLEQSAFHRCEFILTLVDPSDYELSTCQAMARTHHNVVVDHVSDRIGIYTAWNRGVRIARGRYLTNMNADDLRRGDSLELQMAVMDRFEWVDVVYQDVFVTLDRFVGWPLVEDVGARTDLPAATVSTFMSRLNPPHNAPMWRRSLHEEIGWFDDSFSSAGDVDFWIRCARAGKTFFKTSDIHVAYYDNPEGMSTQFDGPGVREHREILRKHGDLLVFPRPTSFSPSPCEDGKPTLRADRVTEGLIDAIHHRRTNR